MEVPVDEYFEMPELRKAHGIDGKIIDDFEDQEKELNRRFRQNDLALDITRREDFKKFIMLMQRWRLAFGNRHFYQDDLNQGIKRMTAEIENTTNSVNLLKREFTNFGHLSYSDEILKYKISMYQDDFIEYAFLMYMINELLPIVEREQKKWTPFHKCLKNMDSSLSHLKIALLEMYQQSGLKVFKYSFDKSFKKPENQGYQIAFGGTASNPDYVRTFGCFYRPVDDDGVLTLEEIETAISKVDLTEQMELSTNIAITDKKEIDLNIIATPEESTPMEVHVCDHGVNTIGNMDMYESRCDCLMPSCKLESNLVLEIDQEKEVHVCPVDSGASNISYVVDDNVVVEFNVENEGINYSPPVVPSHSGKEEDLPPDPTFRSPEESDKVYSGPKFGNPPYCPVAEIEWITTNEFDNEVTITMDGSSMESQLELSMRGAVGKICIYGHRVRGRHRIDAKATFPVFFRIITMTKIYSRTDHAKCVVSDSFTMLSIQRPLHLQLPFKFIGESLAIGCSPIVPTERFIKFKTFGMLSDTIKYLGLFSFDPGVTIVDRAHRFFIAGLFYQCLWVSDDMETIILHNNVAWKMLYALLLSLNRNIMNEYHMVFGMMENPHYDPDPGEIVIQTDDDMRILVQSMIFLHRILYQSQDRSFNETVASVYLLKTWYGKRFKVLGSFTTQTVDAIVNSMTTFYGFKRKVIFGANSRLL